MIDTHSSTETRAMTGCYAFQGYTGAQQRLHLGPTCCGFSVVIHEMLHIMGAEHEQNRPDRCFGGKKIITRYSVEQQIIEKWKKD